MTRSRYGIAVVLQSFGIYRKMKRMTDAAAELHLMQDGEEILGTLCWKKIEHMEDLSMEYWKLRELMKERTELREKIIMAEETLHKAQLRRAALADQNKDLGQDLYNQREYLFEENEKLNHTREDIMVEAAQVKRRFEAIKVKLNVLKNEGQENEDAYHETTVELAQLRNQFGAFKTRITKIDQALEKKADEARNFQLLIDEKNKDSKSDASSVYATISRSNRKISGYKAKLGLLQEEYSRYCRQVGRHLNIHGRTRESKEISQEYRGLLEQVHLLRKSITWNKKLISKAGG